MNHSLVQKAIDDKDLGKTIKKFEINIKNETNLNPLENLLRKKDVVPFDERTSEKQKEENLLNEERNRFVNKGMRNKQNESKNDLDQILNNVSNISIDENLNFSNIITDINDDLEEKEKFFHFDDSFQDFADEKKISSGISGFLSIILILTICTFSLIIISIRNLLQKLFESYILETLKNILMY